PIFLEAVRRRQRLGVVAQVVLAELAGVVAEIEQELGKGRCTWPQVGWAARKLRRDHASAQRIHARKEGVAPGGAALHGNVVHEDRAIISNTVDVRRFAYHQAAMVNAGLHPADIVAHNEEYVGLTGRRLCGCRPDSCEQTYRRQSNTRNQLASYPFTDLHDSRSSVANVIGHRAAFSG